MAIKPGAIKPGVDLAGIAPEMAFVKPDIMEVARGLGVPFMVTCGLDGQHKAGSRHYTGHAIDLRANHVPEAKAMEFAAALGQTLGGQFDVVLERDKKTGKVSHVHVEFDPKPPRSPFLRSG